MRRYWLYTDTQGVTMLHRSDCGHCGRPGLQINGARLDHMTRSQPSTLS